MLRLLLLRELWREQRPDAAAQFALPFDRSGEGRLFGRHCRIAIASWQTRARERLKSLVLNSVTIRLG